LQYEEKMQRYAEEIDSFSNETKDWNTKVISTVQIYYKALIKTWQ